MTFGPGGQIRVHIKRHGGPSTSQSDTVSTLGACSEGASWAKTAPWPVSTAPATLVSPMHRKQLPDLHYPAHPPLIRTSCPSCCLSRLVEISKTARRTTYPVQPELHFCNLYWENSSPPLQNRTISLRPTPSPLPPSPL